MISMIMHDCATPANGSSILTHDVARRVVVTLAIAGGLLCMSGCGEGAAENEQAGASAEVERPTEGRDAPAAANPDEPWTAPEGWTRDAEPRPMRMATYMAPDTGGPVEVAVSRFPGRVGGELANINRWRGQMGLTPVDAEGLEGTIARFDAPGYDGYQARIESATGVMLAAGVYEEAADQTWFVRATVPDAAAADRLEDGVFGMARSIAGLDD
jgi:hypothetical protein